MSEHFQSPHQMADEGKRLYGEKKFRQAALLFGEAAREFTGLGEDLSAAEMRNNQSVAYLRAGAPKQALQAVEGTAEQFAAGGDRKRQAMAVGNHASALEATGKRARALELYTQSARILREIGAGEEYTQVMQSIAALKLKMKKPLAAFTSLQYSLEDVEHPTFFQRVKKWLLDIFFSWFVRK